jgi:hypothetical protein
MNLKPIVGSALIVALLLIGNILLFGLIKGTYGALAHFAFTLVSLLVVLIIARTVFPETRDLLFGIAMIVLISAASFYFAATIRSSQQDTFTLTQNQPLQSDLLSLEQQNAYAGQYIDYLAAEINQSQAINKDLEDRITQLQQQLKQQQTVSPPAVPVVTPPVTPSVVPVVTQPDEQKQEYEEDEERDEQEEYDD